MRLIAILFLVSALAAPALAVDTAHPCVENPQLEACVKLAQELAESTPREAGTSLKEALVANAPAISERLNNAMLKMGEWVEATEAFAVEQTPFLVKEIVWWGVADAGYWVAFGLFFIISSSGYGIFCYQRWDRLREMYGDSGIFARFMAFAVPIVGNFLGIIMVMANIMNALKPLVAPRLYLIEYFRELVN